MPRFLFFLFFSFAFICSKAAKHKQLDKAFSALAEYDYFKSKKLFYNCNQKQINFAAAYGLSTIYYRTDNPFSNNDSALKYISLAYQNYLASHQPYLFAKYRVDSMCILALADSIVHKQFLAAKTKSTVFHWELFLRLNTIASPILRKQAVHKRDELVFERVLQSNKSDCTLVFMKCHPMSDFYLDANLLLQREIYFESTLHQKPDEWISFLKLHPNNIMVNEAYEKLFEFYRKRQSLSGLSLFVKNYPKAPQVLEAWKLLFALSVKAYNSDELNKFLDEYPQFPLKNSILKELELNKLTLYAFQKDDYIGYMNDAAQVVIEPEFDQAGDFYEGLAVVSKNDSVYFINKEKENSFQQFYTEAYPFKNGMAAVKQNNKWFFINRQGQVISKPYEEINELSNNFYVFKLNAKYGALNHFGQMVIEAKFDKLGDFKNNMAYFIFAGKYGFVNTKGHVYQEEFDWISDFDEQGIAIYKLENKFGLINAQGQKISENEFDQMVKLNEMYYLVLKDNLYGFYSKEACFVTPIQYEYNKEKAADYYFKDNHFKLIKNGEQAIMDENGHLDLNFNAFKEINFMSSGLMLVRKKNKFGFIDKKMTSVIPFKFIEAQSFSDGLSIVKFKNQYQIIASNGKEIYVTEKPITKYNAHFYLIGDEIKSLINSTGELLVNDVSAIQQINNSFLLVTFSSGQFQLIKY
ncbi:MAG: WG repeat-containing protein [Bacteroidota bacterium]